jgi:hypothetical protein
MKTATAHKLRDSSFPGLSKKKKCILNSGRNEGKIEFG